MQAYAQASAMLFAEMYNTSIPDWAASAEEVAKRTAAVEVRTLVCADLVLLWQPPQVHIDPLQ